MLSQLRPALILFIAFMLLTGIAYPFAMTGIAQLVFPVAANGGLVKDGDTVEVAAPSSVTRAACS